MAELNNKVRLIGKFASDFKQLKSPSGTSYKAMFAVTRRSGFIDVFPVITFENITITKVKGDTACVIGRIMTRDTSAKTDEGFPKLTTEIYASKISYFGYDRNEASVEIEGKVVGKAHFRYTPKGKHLNNFAVAVPRKNGKTDLIHVLAWDEKAEVLTNIKDGEPIKIKGRLQTRAYTKKSDQSKHKVYEVSLISYERRNNGNEAEVTGDRT